MRTYFLISFFLLVSLALHAVQPVAAVLEIEDKSGKMEKNIIWNATDYLRTKLVASNLFIVVDKTKQEIKLNELVSKNKKASYKLDADSKYQIPLGKALSAQLLIRSRITSFAGKFTFAIEIISIEKEAMISGASSDFYGDEVSLASAIDSTVAKLSTGDPSENKEKTDPANPAVDAEKEIRAALFTNVTLDGKQLEHDAFEGTLAPVLQEKQFYLVDVGRALKAKNAVFAEEIQNGKIPKELSVLEVDGVISVKLSCSTVSEKIRKTNLKSFSCSLSTKVIRMENGEVVYAKSDGLPAYGLNGDQAIQMLLEQTVKDSFGTHTVESRAKWNKGGRWELDIVITRLNDRVKAQTIADNLGTLQGVKESKLVVFNADYVKFRLYGNDSKAVSFIKRALFADSRFPLKVVHETAQTVHAQYNAAALFSRPVDVYFAMDGGNYPDDFVSGTVGSFLMNIDYLTVKSIVREEKKENAIKNAAKAGQKYILFMKFKADKGVWIANAELIDTASKERLLIASGDGETFFGAADLSVRELGKLFKGSVEKPFAEKFFKDRKEAQAFISADEMNIGDFNVGQIMPALIPYYRKNGMGTIVLTNRSDKTIENMQIQYMINEKVAGTQKLGTFKPKETRTVPVTLNALPENRTYGQLQAALTYESGEVFKRSDAYAPIVILDKNTVDWSAPKSIASFIDPNNQAIRDLATSALKSSKLPEGFATDSLAKTALIFSSFWQKPLSYLADPVQPGTNESLDTVQLPSETLSRGAGDCDDLTVLFSALLESVGISTAIVITPGHVFLAAETKLLAGGEVLYGLPKSLFINIDGALYVPIETTAIGSSFAEAWEKGAKAVLGAGKGIVSFRVRQAWKSYPAAFGNTTGKPVISNSIVDLQKLSSSIAELKNRNSQIPSWSKVLSEHILNESSPLPDTATIKKSPIAAALVDWMSGKRNESAKALDGLCEKGKVEACYNLISLILFENRGMEENEAEIYENILAQLPSNVIDMMLDTGGYGLADEVNDNEKIRRQVKEILKKARKKIKEFKGSVNINMKSSFVAGRKGDDISKKKDLFLLLFWGEADFEISK